MPRQLAAMGLEYGPQGAADFGLFIQSEMKRFAEVLRPLSLQR